MILKQLNGLVTISDYVKCKLIRLFSQSSSKPLNNKIVKQWKVVFYGTDELSEVTLKALNNNRLSPIPVSVVKDLHVVCVKSDCPVRRYASLHNLPLYTWPYSLTPGAYDVGIVVSFGHLIPSESILACEYGIINAHPSLLPRWRGAAPIFHTILNGDAETGVTITQVSPNKFDVGKILFQETFRIPDDFTSKMLTQKLSKIAADMIIQTLQDLPNYIKSSYPQSVCGVIYAPKIKPEKCKVTWNNDTPLAIERKLKAFAEFFDVYTYWKDMKVVITKCVSEKEAESANVSSIISSCVSSGFCYFHKRRKVLFVKCKGGWCGITNVKIPVKGPITALDFYNGFISKENSMNCYFSDNKKS